MDLTTSVIVISLSILFSAFFSGMEIAYLAANRLKMEMDIQQKGISARLVAIFRQNPSQYITTMLIGNNIALVVFGSFMGDLVMELLFPAYIGIETYWILLAKVLISTIVILFTAEFLPKILFQVNPNYILGFFSIPAYGFYLLFYFAAKFALFLSNFIIKYFLRGKPDAGSENMVFGKVDLDALVEEAPVESFDSNVIENQDMRLFKNALDFSDVRVRECLIPRTEVIAIDLDDTIENLKQRFIETGFARILIFKDHIDNIVGYVHSSSLFQNPKTIKSAITSVPIVPESMPANKVLKRLNEENKGIAVVVDEFGGTEGIVTQEDIIEEIFGEIEDEHDRNKLVDKQVNEEEFIFSGRLEIDFVNEKYSLTLPKKDEFETIAGLILNFHEDIPKYNQIIEINEKFAFKILEVTNKRIEKVYLTIT